MVADVITEDGFVIPQQSFVASYPCDDSFLTHSERQEIGVRLTPAVSKLTFNGTDVTVIAFGGPSSGKTDSLFGSKSSIGRTYTTKLLDELEKTSLSKLWSVHATVLNIVDGGKIYDALPQGYHVRRSVSLQASALGEIFLDDSPEFDDESGARSRSGRSGSTSRPSGSRAASHTVAPTDPKEMLRRYAVVLRNGEDVEEFYDELTMRSRGRTNSTWQEVVHIAVVPSAGVQQTFGGLLRSVGSATFVELGAGMGTDSEILNNARVMNAQRHTTTTVVGVLGALTRQSLNVNAPSNGYNVHVPYADTPLTLLLEPLLSNGGKAFLIAHVHESPQQRLTSLSTLHSVDQLLRHRYPNGKAPVDYRSVARSQFQRANKLQKELERCTKEWSAEKEQWLADRLMLRKAYTELQEKPAESIGEPDPAATSELSELRKKVESLTSSHHSLKAILSSVQKEKALLESQCSSLQAEVVVLEEDAKKTKLLTAVQQRTLQLQHAAEVSKGLPDDGSVDSLLTSLIDKCLERLAEASLVALPAVEGSSKSPFSAARHKAVAKESEVGPLDTATAPHLHKLSVVCSLLQLVHQLCERERWIEQLLAGETIAPASEKRSKPLYSRQQPDDDSNVQLSWRSWRSLLAREFDTIEDTRASLLRLGAIAPGSNGTANALHSMIHSVGPKLRSKSLFSLYNFASTTSPSVFSKYWASSSAKPPDGSNDAGTFGSPRKNTILIDEPRAHTSALFASPNTYGGGGGATTSGTQVAAMFVSRHPPMPLQQQQPYDTPEGTSLLESIARYREYDPTTPTVVVTPPPATTFLPLVSEESQQSALQQLLDEEEDDLHGRSLHEGEEELMREIDEAAMLRSLVDVDTVDGDDHNFR